MMRPRVIRRHKEYIEKDTEVLDDGRRRQRSRKIKTDERNPKKLTIARGGNWELFAYPGGSNPTLVFLRIKRAVETFEIEELRRLMKKLERRLGHHKNRVMRGVKRRNTSGRAYEKAYQAGSESTVPANLGQNSKTLKTASVGPVGREFESPKSKVPCPVVKPPQGFNRNSEDKLGSNRESRVSYIRRIYGEGGFDRHAESYEDWLKRKVDWTEREKGGRKLKREEKEP